MDTLYLRRFNRDSKPLELRRELALLEGQITEKRKEVNSKFHVAKYSEIIRLHNAIAGMIAKKEYIRRMIFYAEKH